MKACIWTTGHSIADTVAKAVYEGCDNADIRRCDTFDTAEGYDCHIAYGILRGTTQVFRAAKEKGIPFIEIDKGYWKPGHFDGYYRVSLNGTQQTTFKGLEPDYALYNRLSIDIRPPKASGLGQVLVCPPTEYVKRFFGEWQKYLPANFILRPKGCDRPLEEDLDKCSKVITFNSSVGWEALRQGIEVISDPTQSIVGSYQKSVDFPLHISYEERRKFFAIQASLQLTLNEIRSGSICNLVSKLLKSS